MCNIQIHFYQSIIKSSIVANRLLVFKQFPNMCKRYNLAWNEFDTYTTLAFKDLLFETDFADVTLVCDDDKQFSAHKVILSACSPFLGAKAPLGLASVKKKK